MPEALAKACGTAIAVQEGPNFTRACCHFLSVSPALIQLAGNLRKPLSDGDMFLADALRGLRAKRKWLPCKYFYDRRGSELFDQICQLPEYYLTRTELAIMREHANEMAAWIGSDAVIVELGSGSSEKTRLLLDHCAEIAAYVPVDISEDYLRQSVDRLSREYAQLRVLPACGDFTVEIELPKLPGHSKTVVYFPGSTVGNFTYPQARRLLNRMRKLCGRCGGLLIGIDLVKDASVIEAAYNDVQRVTAEFNLNLLTRINRELDGDFDLGNFRHDAIYDASAARIEMRLVSRRRQTVAIGRETIDFAAGEAIRTEYSHKYTLASFTALAATAGFAMRQCWTDRQKHFAVCCLETAGRINGYSHNGHGS